MKSPTLLILFATLITSAVHASHSEAISIECTGAQGSTAYTVFASRAAGSTKATVTLTETSDHSKQEESLTFKDTDVMEIFSGHKRFNLLAGHHNNVVSVSSDRDIFGVTGTELEGSWAGKMAIHSRVQDQDKLLLVNVQCGAPM